MGEAIFYFKKCLNKKKVYKKTKHNHSKATIY